MTENGLLAKYIVPGASVRLKMNFSPTPLHGEVVEVADGFIVLRGYDGRLTVTALRDMLVCTVLNVADVRIGGKKEEEPSFSSASPVEAALREALPGIGNMDDEDLDNDDPISEGASEMVVRANIPERSEMEERQPYSGGDRPLSIGDVMPPAKVFTTEAESPAVKVVGRIDLSSFRSKPRRNTPSMENNGYRPTRDNEEPWMKEMVPASAVVCSNGPQFGFLKSGDSDEPIYFSRSQVLFRKGEEPLAPGDEVVFTAGRNSKGLAARTVHRAMTIGQTLRMMDRLNSRNQRNMVEDLRDELLAYFPDNETLRNELYSRGYLAVSRIHVSRQAHRKSFELPAETEVPEGLAELMQQYNGSPSLTGASLLRAEKNMAEKLLPGRFDTYLVNMDTILEYAKQAAQGLVHHLYTRMLSVAPNETDHASIRDNAVEFFNEIDAPRSAQFFARMMWKDPERHEKEAAAFSGDSPEEPADSDASADATPSNSDATPESSREATPSESPTQLIGPKENRPAIIPDGELIVTIDTEESDD